MTRAKKRLAWPSANELRVLRALRDRPGMSVVEVRACTGLSPRGIYTTLNRMQVKGLVDHDEACWWNTHRGSAAIAAAEIFGV